MTWQQISGSNFEERLLAGLKAEVGERGFVNDAPASGASSSPARRRRAPRLVLGGVAVASLAVALAFSAGGENPPVAFAVEPQPEGELNVEIRSLEDPRGLEEALEEAGVPASVNYLAAGMACKEPRFRAAPWPDGDRAIVTGPGREELPFVFQLSRNAVGPGQTLVVTASPSPEVLLGIEQLEIAEGAVAPCEPISAPASQGGN